MERRRKRLRLEASAVSGHCIERVAHRRQEVVRGVALGRAQRRQHAMRIEERVDGFRVLLQNILSVHLTLETKALNEVSVNQNEQVQKISAWAAILFAPTLIGTIYGMNFTNMPELDWRLGYPMALGLMLLVSIGLYLIFKRRRWI